jgi:hypothetical protein
LTLSSPPAYYVPMNVLLILACLVFAAVLINIPLGYLRQSVEKFSFAWYFYVHISIPLIIYLRIKAGYSWKLIPLTVAGAVLGQVIGGRLRRRRDADG